jgi:hypothetical protein
VNEKQRRFVAEYLVDLNATKAAERLRPVVDLEDDVAAALGSIEVHREKTRRRSTGEDDVVSVEEYVIKVKAWPKVQALELLAKHFGIIKEHHEHTGKGGGPIDSRVVFGGRYRPDGTRAIT